MSASRAGWSEGIVRNFEAEPGEISTFGFYSLIFLLSGPVAYGSGGRSVAIRVLTIFTSSIFVYFDIRNQQ